MELPMNDVTKQGYLKFKGRMGMWQKQWVILKKKSSKGGRRLERFADEKSSQNNNPADKPIDLELVTSVTRLPADIKKHALAITFSNKDSPTRMFCCDSDAEAAAWKVALESLCLSREVPNVASIDLLQSGPTQKELTDLFNVFLLPSLNLAFYGECMLQITQEYMHLLDSNNPGRRLVSWPLNALRRYGSDETKFTFESGRRCDTGEGLFILTTKEADSIYRKVNAAALAIAEMHRLIHQHDRQQQHTVASRSQSSPAIMKKPPASPLRSISSPGPELPPWPPQHKPVVRSPGTSAVNMELPPVPGASVGEYLECFSDKYKDSIGAEDNGPPAEIAPVPPGQEQKLPAGYLPMTGGNQGEKDEYVSLRDRNRADYLSLKRPNFTLDDGVSPQPFTANGPSYTNQIDSNAKTAQPGEEGRDYYGSHLQRQMAKAEVGETAKEAGNSNADGQEEEYIYAEKGLSPAFRCYLKERKEGND